jgi:hypothetical protein
MSELTTQERLKQAQAKVRALMSSREKIVGDARVEEQKLKQAFANLKELGIESPEEMTIEELKALEVESKAKLEQLLETIEVQLVKGEDLMKQYNQLQEN